MTFTTSRFNFTTTNLQPANTKMNLCPSTTDSNLAAKASITSLTPSTTNAASTSHRTRTHTAISPSKLKSLELSPKWIQDETQGEHPLTAAGTRMHEAIETWDVSKLSREEEELVEVCRLYLEELHGETLGVNHEVELEITDDGIKGHADLVLQSLYETRAYYVDWKFGFNMQEDAETNPAAQAYALGIFRKWHNVQEVEVHYVYPRLEQVSTAVYRRTDIPRIQLRIETIRSRVNSPDVECTPYPETCTYCGNKPTCAVLHKMILPLATRYGKKHELTVSPTWEPSAIKSPEQAGKMFQAMKVLEAWVESAKYHVTKYREETGQEIPGTTYNVRSGKRKILNPLLAYEVAKEFGVTNEQFLRSVTVSVKDLLDVAAENAPRGQKAQVKQAIENKLSDAGTLEVGPEYGYLSAEKITNNK